MNILDTALSLVAPHQCVVCNAEGAVLCKSCAATLPTLPSICYVCGKATKHNSPCQQHKSSSAPIAVYIDTDYQGAIKKLIKAYKFDYKRSAAKDIAYFLQLNIPYLDSDYVLTYVPATGSHIRERGFNHMQAVTKALAKMQKSKVTETLVRVTSVTQKGADRPTRKKQLANAFRPLASNVVGKKLLLVDDVVTTGATIEATVKLLYKAGAQEVRVAVVARTP